MEKDWDLQAVPVAARSPTPGMFPRLGSNMLVSTSIQPRIPLKSFHPKVPTLTRTLPENLNPSQKLSCFHQSEERHELRLNEPAKELENTSSENKLVEARPPLPRWLQNAKLDNDNLKATDHSQRKDQELLLKQNAPELQKKFSFTSQNLGSPLVPPASLYNPKLFVGQPTQPKLKPMSKLGDALQLNSNTAIIQPSKPTPGSPVRTELVLGPKVSETATDKNEQTREENVKDFLGGLFSEPQKKSIEKLAGILDASSFKKLLKGLMESVWWQPEAASTVASSITLCQSGNGKRRGSGSRGDIWLMFAGPDRVGKRKLVSVLSEHARGSSPIMISLGSRRDDEEQNTNFRGKTALDRIVEAVRRNPFSVIMLEDIDEADMLLRSSIKMAAQRGRLTDSHGREISLGNVIFILTGNWSTCDDGHSVYEKKLSSIASGNWRLKLTIGEKNAKRRASWMHDADRPIKPRKEPISGLSFDLNQAADADEEKTDGSRNSSDLTVDHEEEHCPETRQFAITSVPPELANAMDDLVAFKPVDFAFVHREIKKTISVKFSILVDDNLSIHIEDSAIEKIVGGLWQGRTCLGEWVDNVLGPAFEELQTRIPSSTEGYIAQLRLDQDAFSDGWSIDDWLPSRVSVMVDGA